MISIRLSKVEDAEEMYALVDANRTALERFIWAQNATLESTIEFLKYRTSDAKSNTAKIHGIYLDGKLIGECSFNSLDPHEGYQLGYWMSQEYRGRGHMKEAVTLMMKMYEDDQYPYYAEIIEDNAASLWLLWGLGYKEDHRYRKVDDGPIWVKLVNKQHCIPGKEPVKIQSVHSFS